MRRLVHAGRGVGIFLSARPVHDDACGRRRSWQVLPRPSGRPGGIVMRRTAFPAITAVGLARSIPAAAETVKFTGCPVVAAERCLIVRNGAVVYNISSARPAPRVGYRAISVTADISGSIGLCFAKPLDHIRWHYIRQRCR